MLTPLEVEGHTGQKLAFSPQWRSGFGCIPYKTAFSFERTDLVALHLPLRNCETLQEMSPLCANFALHRMTMKITC